MPAYKKDINKEVMVADAQEMMDNARNNQEKTLVAILYLTGARPIEAVALKAGDIETHANPDYFTIKLMTAKLRKGTYHGSDTRVLEIPKTAPFAQQILNEVVNIINPEAHLFGFHTPDNVKQIVYKLSNGKFCPYNFRHSRMLKLSRAGAGTSEIMYWKGATSSRSVDAYLRGKPIGRKLTIE